MIITYKGAEFDLDVERAIEAQVLKPRYPLKPGDVYIDPMGVCNPFLLIQAAYEKPDSFALMGMGCTTNSNPFFSKTHTTEEIAAYLREKGMVFRDNVNMSVVALTHNSPK